MTDPSWNTAARRDRRQQCRRRRAPHRRRGLVPALAAARTTDMAARCWRVPDDAEVVGGARVLGPQNTCA